MPLIEEKSDEVTMKEETKKDENTGIQEKAYKLLSSVSKGQDLTVRDDLFEFSWLLDSVKIARKKGCRFRLVDSGQLDGSQLEWLAKAGADLYTSDEFRCDAFELDLLSRACRKAGSFVAYFHNGLLEQVNEEEKSLPITFSALLNLTRSGIYLHLTNKENKRDFSHLNSIAHACQRGGSWVVYYHHGPLILPWRNWPGTEPGFMSLTAALREEKMFLYSWIR